MLLDRRQREYANIGPRVGFKNCLGAGCEGGAGGHHIIHKQEVFAAQAFRDGGAVDALCVGQSFLAAEVGLAAAPFIAARSTCMFT